MQDINLILSENADFKFVGVKFFRETTGTFSSRTYHYKTILDLAVGDKVIVDSPNSGLVIVDVVEVAKHTQVSADFRYKWIVQKVDTTEYERLNEQEELILETLAEYRGAKLKKEMYSALQEELGTSTLNKLKKLARL